MKNESNNHTFEHNIERLLKSAKKKEDAAFEERVIGSVLDEVGGQRSKIRLRRWLKGISITAAAAVLMVTLLNVPFEKRPMEVVGEVRNLYGMVGLRNGGVPENITGIADIHAGQWIETFSGSKAEIVLKDLSRLLPGPRTVFQLIGGKNGQGILLKQGFLAIEASKQLAGKSLMVETPGSQIKILGTKLDVRVIQRPGGGKRTQVRVSSGSVELESSGEKVLLLRHTEGIADEGNGPIVRSLTAEVNEMIRLIGLSREFAEEAGAKAGGASILDFHVDGSTTVWTVVSVGESEQTGAEVYSVKLKYPAREVRAFTVGGAALETSKKGQTVQIDFSQLPSGVERNKVILKLANIKGMFRVLGEDVFEFSRPGEDGGVISMFQFRMPEYASIEDISPEPIEQYKKLNKIVITVASDSQMVEVCD